MASLPIQINGFNTQDDRAWHSNDQSDILVTHTFQKPYPSPPKIIMGLDFVDVCVGTGTMDTGTINKDTIGIKSTAEEIDDDTFQARIGIWGDGGMSAGGCKWIEAAHKNLNNIQSGDFEATQHLKTLDVVFDPPFATEPTVLVWLQGFQLDSTKGWEFRGRAVPIDNIPLTQKFRLHVETVGTTVLYRSRFSWMAFEKSNNQICGGVCELKPPPPAGGQSERRDEKTVNFGTTFTKAPRVVQCISGMKVHDNQNGLRIDTTGATATENYIKCPVRTWASTSVYVHVSWIAVA